MQNLTFQSIKNTQNSTSIHFIIRKKPVIIYKIHIIKLKTVKTTLKNRKNTDESIAILKYICTIENRGC
jgi:hypothetical protein